MLDYAAYVLTKIEDGAALKPILMSEKDPSRLTLQIMMEWYFKIFEIGKIWLYSPLSYIQ